LSQQSELLVHEPDLLHVLRQWLLEQLMPEQQSLTPGVHALPSVPMHWVEQTPSRQ
jgi:hypothetical protein